MRVLEKEAELGGAKFRHKEERVVPGNEALSEMDEAGFRAIDENVGWSEPMMTKRARCIIACARSKTVGIVSVESMTHDQLEAHRLKIA